MKRIIIFLISLFFTLRKFSNDFIIPIISFLQEMKRYSEYKKTRLTEKNYKTKLFFSLEKWQHILDTLINSFIEAANTLLPEQVSNIPVGHDNILRKFLIIQMYIEHLKTLTNKQRNMLLIKTASLMLVNMLFALGKPQMTETSADVYCQTCYCYMKENNMLI